MVDFPRFPHTFPMSFPSFPMVYRGRHGKTTRKSLRGANRKETVMTARMKIRRQVVRASGQWPILRNIFWTYLEWDLASGIRLHSYENGDRNTVVDLAINSMVIFHCYVTVYQRVIWVNNAINHPPVTFFYRWHVYHS